MVHALNEAWTVLVPDGVMVDVRPLSVDVPLEVVHAGGSDEAGLVDLSPGLKFDLAADRAINEVLGQGLFCLVSSETFDYAYVWKTFHGMRADFAERWEGEINVPKAVLNKARQLYRQYRPVSRLRLPMRMRLGIYLKLVLDHG